jgi:hypothetical protein
VEVVVVVVVVVEEEEEAVVVEVEEVTVPGERGEIEVIAETVIVIGIGIEIVIVTVTVTVTEKGGMIEKVQVTVAVTAVPHNNKINHLNSNQLLLTAIMQLPVCNHPITCNLHPWVVHQTTCGEA